MQLVRMKMTEDVTHLYRVGRAREEVTTRDSTKTVTYRFKGVSKKGRVGF